MLLYGLKYYRKLLSKIGAIMNANIDIHRFPLGASNIYSLSRTISCCYFTEENYDLKETVTVGKTHVVHSWASASRKAMYTEQHRPKKIQILKKVTFYLLH